MALVLVGNLDVDKSVKIIEASIKNNEPFNEPIKKLYPDEPNDISMPYIEKEMAIAMPMFMMGFKDNDVNLNGEQLMKKHIEITLLLRMLFGKGSDIYKKLYDMNLINKSFSYDYTMQCDYGFSALEGESRDPQRVYDIIIEELDKLNETGLSEEDFERTKKVLWGQYIRSHNDIEDYAVTFMQMLFTGCDYFDYYDVYKTVTFDDVCKRFKTHFDKNYAALSVVKPIEKSETAE